MRSIILSKTQFLYLFAVLFVVLPVIVVIAFLPVLSGAWCRQFDVPRYEQEFGFRLAGLRTTASDGSVYTVLAITAVTPDGAFARAGSREGDVPRMYHGVCDFSGALGFAAQGHAVELRVRDARRPEAPWRTVRLEGRQQ